MAEDFAESPIDVSYITGGSEIAVAIVSSVLSILFLGLRFYARRLHKMALGWDDWLLVPAAAITVGMGIAMIVGAAGKGVGYGKGLPEGAPPVAEFTYLSPQIILTEQVQFAVQLMSVLAVGFIKLSFLTFYRRIFIVSKDGWFHLVTLTMICVTTAWTISFFFVFLFYCNTHIDKEWGTVLDVIQYCPGAFDKDISLGVTDAILDLIIIALPVPMIARLHLELSKRLAVIGIFLMGGFAVAASIVRMGVFVRIFVVGFDANVDGDKDVGLILFWSMLEAGAGVVAASLPLMKLLFVPSSLDKFLRSVRTAFRLRSQSTKSYESYPSISDASNTDNGASGYIQSEGNNNSNVKSYAMHELK